MAKVDFAQDLRETVLNAAGKLRAFSAERAAQPRAPRKWSPKQIIGHLIDSASNNHQRFVRARFRTDLRFDGYDPDEWSELLDLWTSFNLHIARVMETTPSAALLALRSNHNLDMLAWETVPADEPVSLEYFMRDYVAHLKHHLRQIDTDLAEPPSRQRN